MTFAVRVHGCEHDPSRSPEWKLHGFRDEAGEQAHLYAPDLSAAKDLFTALRPDAILRYLATSYRSTPELVIPALGAGNTSLTAPKTSIWSEL